MSTNLCTMYVNRFYIMWRAFYAALILNVYEVVVYGGTYNIYVEGGQCELCFLHKYKSI